MYVLVLFQLPRQRCGQAWTPPPRDDRGWLGGVPDFGGACSSFTGVCLPYSNLIIISLIVVIEMCVDFLFLCCRSYDQKRSVVAQHVKLTKKKLRYPPSPPPYPPKSTNKFPVFKLLGRDKKKMFARNDLCRDVITFIGWN